MVLLLEKAGTSISREVGLRLIAFRLRIVMVLFSFKESAISFHESRVSFNEQSWRKLRCRL